MKAKHSSGISLKIVPLIIIIAAVLVAVVLVKSKPKSDRKVPEKQAMLVEVVSVEPRDATIIIEQRGTVVAAREVELRPQVSGKIVEMDEGVIPGGVFERDSVLMKIEPKDYELMVQQRQSDVANAESSLRIELGNQDVAKQEYSLLGNVISEADRELVLRKPQLTSAQSALETAKSRLEQAELDLDRTNIRSPFNAVVNMKSVDVGQVVSQSSNLVTLTGIDEYWVEVYVKVDELKWMKIPKNENEEGSEVKIFNSSAWGEGDYRMGRVVRLSPVLEEKARLAKLIISIKDPLLISEVGSNKKKLLLNSYVRVEIIGELLESACVLDSSLLHNGNIWICGADNTLHIRPVDIVHRNDDEVIISDRLTPGDRIITTNLSAPVEGMLLGVDRKGTEPVIAVDGDKKGVTNKDTDDISNPGMKR